MSAQHLLKTQEAANLLGVSKRTLQERVASREIAAVKIGKAIRFDPRDIEAFIDRCKLRERGWKKSTEAAASNGASK